MIILFDVGNSNIKVGLVEEKTIKQVFRLKTEIHKTTDEYYFLLKNLINDNVEGVIISSVVPELTLILTQMCEDYYKITPLVFNQGIKTGIMIKADNPKEVGADLIADCVGASNINEQVLIVDLGTATKFIFVDHKVFKGCVIAPGVQSSLNSLVSSTALLPKIDLIAPKKVLGNNTINCMQSGITYGFASLVDGIIEKIKKEVNLENLFVIATGGLANEIIPLCKNKIVIDEFLTLKGIYEVYKKNQGN